MTEQEIHDINGAEGTYYVHTYGCQMNVYDSEILAALLEDMGLLPAADADSADVVIFNTCCIRDNADQKVYGRLGDFKAQKQANPRKVVAVAGCLAQKDKQALLDRFPQVDIVLGTHEVRRLPELVKAVWEGRAAQANAKGRRRPKSHAQAARAVQQLAVSREGNHLDLPARPKTQFSAMVPISVGCNQWCTYCIVPYVRGSLHSRPLSVIVSEVKRLAASGFRELTLLGQNVNDYGRDFRKEVQEGGDGKIQDVDFADVLNALRDVPGLDRLRFTSPHPAYFKDNVIAAMAANPKVCEHIHLPLQSGDDEILRIMKRGYTGDEFVALAERMRAAIPNLSITTDIIVGFAGETREQFEHTLDVVRRVRFDSAFMFAYSERPGTPGAVFKNQVPQEERMERLHELIEVQNAISQDNHEKRVGQTVEILVEGPSKKEPGLYTGRTRQHWLVHFPCEDSALIGQLINVHLDRAFMWGFTGSRA